QGDAGETALVGGERVSKASLRVEAYGTIDELTSLLGFARSICDDAEVRELTKGIQRELFAVSASVANPRSRERETPYVTAEMVEALTAHVQRVEATEGILSDWSLPGEHAAAAAYDVARTVCRRAERAVVRLAEAGEDAGPPDTVAYLNRLSDLLWLTGRLLELRAGVNARLRDDEHKGPRWSRAW
ncbi:MAG TPA: cob(I)yrinic acid a,c-diamide adenosyltransferase, partial [Pyrinomonadaceae bacterium]|nr:cob(I)yrinic acid a,c-diamide adenosyltransferase [Pyrinomonadaceae bacterium]